MALLSLVTAPAAEPLTLAEAKLHLRVDSDDTSQDTLITSLIVAAREAVEEHTRRALVTQTWDYVADAFPDGDEPILVGKPPLQSVTTLQYVDADGVLQTWAASNYVVDTATIDGAIRLAYDVSWPSAREQYNAVQVRVVAGYGLAAAVPASIKAAMLLLIGHLFEHRESVVTGTIVAELPTVRALLGPYRYLVAV